MKNVLRAAVAAAALMVSTPAFADIELRQASDDQGILVHGTGDEQLGETVTGALGANGPQIVNFDATTEGPTNDIRLQGGEGQADVTGAEMVVGGNPNDGYGLTSGNIYLNNGDGMTWIEFALTSGDAGTIDFYLTDNEGTVFEFLNQVIGEGDTFFAFAAVDGQLIDNVFWEADVDPGSINILKQVRILRESDSTVVPEPGTWAMMLMGFGAAGVAMRRRRRDGSKLAQLA